MAIEAQRQGKIQTTLRSRAQVRDSIEGTCIALVAFMIAVAVVLAPPSAFQLKTRARAVMLGVIVTCWILSLFAGWKLSAPAQDRLAEQRVSARKFLRYSILVILGAGGVACFANQLIDSNALPIVGLLLGCAALVCAGTAYYVHLGRLSAAMDSTILPVICFILAPMNALAVLTTLAPRLDADPSSLAGMYEASALQFGSCEMLHELLQGWSQWRDVGFWSVIFAIFYLAFVFVHLRLLILLIQTNRKLKHAGAAMRWLRLF